MIAQSDTSNLGVFSSSTTIALSVSHSFRNKQALPGTIGPMGNEWKAVDWPLDQIVAHITTGNAICVSRMSNEHRAKENVVSSQLMGIDLDNGPDLDTLWLDDFIATYAAFGHYTPNSTPEAPRCRVYFILDAPITELEHYEKLVCRLLHELKRRGIDGDKACKDASRLFFGSTQPNYRVELGCVLPLSVLESLPESEDEKRQANCRPKNVKVGTTSLPVATPLTYDSVATLEKKIRSALPYIPAWQEYDQWRNILMAVHSVLPDQRGVDLIEAWSPGKEGEVAAKFRSFGRSVGKPITIGTLFYEAKRYGWDMRSYYPDRSSTEYSSPEGQKNLNEEPQPQAESEDVLEAEARTDWKAFPDTILSSLLRCLPGGTPLFRILAIKFGLTLFTQKQARLSATGEGMSRGTFNRMWELLTTGFCPLLESIDDQEIHSKSGRFRILPSIAVCDLLRKLEKLRIYEQYHLVGAPPKHGNEDKRIVAIPTSAMIRDSDIDEDILSELTEVLRPVFEAQRHAERWARDRAEAEYRRICASYNNQHETPLFSDIGMNTVPDLTAVYFHAYVTRHNGEPLSRAEISRLTGAADSSIRALCKRANVIGENPKNPAALNIVTVEDINEITAYGRRVRGMAYQVVSTMPDGSEVVRGLHARKDTDGMRQICTMALNSEATSVKVIYQTAKEYHTMGLPLPINKRKKMDVDEEIEESEEMELEGLGSPSEGQTVSKGKKQSKKPEVVKQPEGLLTDPHKHTPQWLVGQYQLALERSGWLRDRYDSERLVNRKTGEYAPDDPAKLLETILDRPLKRRDVSRDPDYYERESTPAELAVRHAIRAKMLSEGWKLIYPKPENKVEAPNSDASATT